MKHLGRSRIHLGLAGLLVGIVAACTSPAAPTAPSSAPAALVNGVAYIGQSVSDIERSTAFYRTTAGLTVVAEDASAGSSALKAIAGKSVSVKTRLLKGATGQIRLMQFQSPSAAARSAPIVPVQGPGITHVCHQSPDSQPLFAKFLNAGAKPVSRTGDVVQLRPDVPVRYGYARDPDGTMMEAEQIMREGLPWSYRMRHVAIAVGDIERTVAFYETLLGYPARERRSNLVNKNLDTTGDLDNIKLDVAWFNLRNLELEVWQYLNHPMPAVDPPRPIEALGYNMIVLDVTSTEEAVARLLKAGGRLEVKPTPMDGGRIAFGRDPDGNLIGLFQVNDASPYSARRLGVLENG